jgi:N-acyl-phosphatidylethanolamine-hydrolysing phospholipase D
MSASTAAVLYASVISSPLIAGAVPEDAKDKPHHVSGGKSFKNPWESYLDRTIFQIITILLRCANFVFQRFSIL